MKKKIYVVWVGRKPGIYDSWEECEEQTAHYAGARFKGFVNRAEAEQAWNASPEEYIACKAEERRSSPAVKRERRQVAGPILPALAVDAACSGNPGDTEFRGVITDTGTEVFRRGPFKQGTNNIGEFLAIVLGLAWLKQHGLPWVLYSDSRTAIAWVRKKQAATKLTPNKTNAPLFEMISAAEHWLRENTWTTEIRKWDTEEWGEIPADFGRK